MHYKRGRWFHYDFALNGARYRGPLETTDWREAARKESELKSRAQAGELAGKRAGAWGRLGFEEVMKRYLAERKIEIRCPEFEVWISKPLCAFFRGRRLSQVTTDAVKDYRVKRRTGGKAAKTVNHEVGLLLRLLKRARLRHLVELKPLPKQKKKWEALTAAEKARLFEVAASKPAWHTAFCATLLTANTTLRPVELKRLKWADLDPVNRELAIWESKTEAGTRAVPLNDEAWAAIAALKMRADSLGIYAPDFYVLPRLYPRIDPTKPMGRSGWRTAWRSLRAQAAQGNSDTGREAMPKLSKLRFYDLRHQSITEMLEAGIPEGVIREIAGHLDPEMTRHYSHPRREARRLAVEAIAQVGTGGFSGGYATTHVTKLLTASSVELQVIEKNGRGAQI